MPPGGGAHERRRVVLQSIKVQAPQIPLHFRCPISLELMRDPVILCTGHTYDRSSIETWVGSGNTTCPVTMQQLADFTLTPNHTLRRLIQAWCAANASLGVQRIPTPKQPADVPTINALLDELSSGAGSGPGGAAADRHRQIAALSALTAFAKEGRRNQTVIVQAGAVPVLEAIFFRPVDHHTPSSSSGGNNCGNEDEDEDEDQEIALQLANEALASLCLLPLCDEERLRMASPRRRLSWLSQLLNSSSSCSSLSSSSVTTFSVETQRSLESRFNAAALVLSLADSMNIKPLLASSPPIIHGLLHLVSESSSNPNSPWSPRAMKLSLKAIFSLCLCRQGIASIVNGGAPHLLIDTLVSYSSSCSSSIPSSLSSSSSSTSHLRRPDVEQALGAIDLICTTDSGCQSVALHSLAIPVLVKLILHISERATEYATGSLLSLCSQSTKLQDEALQAGIIKELLLLIQSQCTNRAKSKAMALLKLFQASLFDLDEDHDHINHHHHHQHNLLDLVPDYGRTDVVPF